MPLIRTLLLLAFTAALSTVWGQQLDVGRVYEERDVAQAAKVFESGDYVLAARVCEDAIRQGAKLPDWRLLRLRALMRMGQETMARDEAQLAVKTFPGNLELLMLQQENALRLGRGDIAQQALAEVNMAARAKSAKDRTAAEWVALGQAALALGADAKKVIEQYFVTAEKKDPKLEEAYLAEGRLALAKDDAKRAADVFRAGLKAHGETADLRAGLALAFENSDREKMAENLTRALELNPVHDTALLRRAEMLIGAEKFAEADASLQKLLGVRGNSPEAWALRSAIAALSAGDARAAEAARMQGLQRWDRNPEVDHIIGRVLSRAYRFAEGAPHQRRALEFDADYLPAKVQLCHDLLRLGQEDEAWKIAAGIRKQDGYNVQAHNLGLLEQEMKGYATHVFDDFVLRMPKRDWPIYGERALALLREAKRVLGPKYGLDLNHPVLVEFFGSQQDFAIRTFGSLGGQGLLGVCFGTVITVNSPGSLAHGRNNWESTLWHEFCHVVTLGLTNNKMPRWLSEGISVYEEGQRDPAWGMAMNAKFREMIVEQDAITPVGQLSAAFLNAESEDALMFAYYQSSQVVGYLLERYGPDSFKGILRDLAAGKRINDAIAANTEALEQVEKEFHRYLNDKAQTTFGSLADWKQPTGEEVNPLDAESFAAYRKDHPANLWAAHKYAAAMMEEENWAEAIKAADVLIRLVPEDYGADSGYRLKAAALRKAQRLEEEGVVLRTVAEHDASALPVFLRLIETDTGLEDWPEVRVNANRAIALNPFLRAPQQALGDSAAALGDADAAVAAYERVIVIDPGAAAMTHFQLGQLLRSADPARARRHLLDSLALAPRFRAGYRMLLDWPVE